LATFILVHGSFHDGGAWSGVVERLKQRGHEALAPTLAGHGKGVDKDVTHAQCTRSVVDFIVDRDLSDVILVGHSFGGTVICKVVEAIPERIHRLVFYAGLVLCDGESIYDAAPPEQRAAMDQLVAASSDGTLMLPFDLWRDGYIGDADLEVARWAYEQLSPQPFQTFLDRVDMKKFYTLQVPRSYIIGADDCAMPPGEWQLHPRMTSRLGLFRLVQMPGGHELMFSNPKGLMDSIIVAGRD
jgi:pimeloyl-ACP methyl ester carboxylesterase